MWTRAAASAAALMIDTSAQGAWGKGVSPTAAPTSSDSVVLLLSQRIVPSCLVFWRSRSDFARKNLLPHKQTLSSPHAASPPETTANLGPCHLQPFWRPRSPVWIRCSNDACLGSSTPLSSSHFATTTMNSMSATQRGLFPCGKRVTARSCG